MYNKVTSEEHKTTLGLTSFNSKDGENLQNGYEDGIKLFYSDPQSIINCKKGINSVQCCKNNGDLIGWEQLKSGNTFRCIDKGSLSQYTMVRSLHLYITNGK